MHHIPADITVGVDGVDLYVPDHDNHGILAAPVPPRLISSILTFVRAGNRVSKITGKRSEVHLTGAKSEPWQRWAARKGLRHCTRFIESVRGTIRALAIRAGYDDITMSPDVVALVGAEAEQTPHIDLLPGQVQAIMALTPNAKPTLAYGFNDKSVHRPLPRDAFDHLSISETSESVFASVLRCAPSLGQLRETLLSGMRPISLDTFTAEDRRVELEQTGLIGSSTRRRRKRYPAGSVTGMPSPLFSSAQASSAAAATGERKHGRWSQGTLMLADHAVVHCGPQQDVIPGEPPRIVIFTTFTGYRDKRLKRLATRKGETASFYNVNAQYLPYHLFEDPTMPNDRVVSLLKEWAQEKPYLAFIDNMQNDACRMLCMDDSLSDEKIADCVRILRTPPLTRTYTLGKRSRCGQCANCMLKVNCKQCIFCKDMKSNGGPNRLKQACVRRKCVELGGILRVSPKCQQYSAQSVSDRAASSTSSSSSS
jgi:hypothetical protein